MTLLISEATARTRSPGALVARLRDRMADHGIGVAGSGAETRILLPGATALLLLREGAVGLRVEAACPDRLADAQAVLAGHLDAFAPAETLGILWRGGAAAAGGGHPHNFRALRVVGVTDVAPRMRRVTLAGERLERFRAGGMHAKILIPAPGVDPVWPGVGPGGQPVLDGCGLIRRSYTIRRLDLAAGTLDIDFLLHGEEGPGSVFALRARPGDRLGILGPGGGTVPVGRWTLLAGDETALPAIARALEGMHAGARGLELIEVADAGEAQPLRHPAGIALRWVHRGAAPHGARLLEAARAATLPVGEEVTCWGGCENGTARALRDHWGGERGLDRARYRAVAYWRHGGDGEG